MLSRTKLRSMLLGSLAIGLLPVGVLARSTTASCLSGFNWMTNSKDQSPCLLASYLQGLCDRTQSAMPALPPDDHYTGPYANQQNPCECSSVTYNAVSACGLCQNRTIVSWSTWGANCSTVYPGFFPPGVPDDTAIPRWAFQNVTTSDSFNVTLALSVGNNPESTSLATSAPVTSTGRFIGGVIGGVAGVALIAGLAVFFVVKRKRSRRIPPSAQFASSQDLAPLMFTGDKNVDINPKTWLRELSDPSPDLVSV